jgi:O-methyltransferase
MSRGGICVLMDYHDPARTLHGWDCSPGVKLACDRFLFDRPERIRSLFGDEYSHAFFRKE